MVLNVRIVLLLHKINFRTVFKASLKISSDFSPRNYTHRDSRMKSNLLMRRQFPSVSGSGTIAPACHTSSALILLHLRELWRSSLALALNSADCQQQDHHRMLTTCGHRPHDLKSSWECDPALCQLCSTTPLPADGTPQRTGSSQQQQHLTGTRVKAKASWT